MESRRQWVLENTAGRGADVAIQCATGEAVPEGLTMLGPGGRYVWTGGGGRLPSIPFNRPLPNDHLHRHHNGGRETLAAGRRFLASRDSLPFDKMISGTYTLEQT